MQTMTEDAKANQLRLTHLYATAHLLSPIFDLGSNAGKRLRRFADGELAVQSHFGNRQIPLELRRFTHQRIPLKLRICKSCSSVIVDGINCRVQLKRGKVVQRCVCGGVNVIPYKSASRKKDLKESAAAVQSVQTVQQSKQSAVKDDDKYESNFAVAPSSHSHEPSNQPSNQSHQEVKEANKEKKRKQKKSTLKDLLASSKPKTNTSLKLEDFLKDFQ
jgi:RNase P subunit RPR2